MGYLNDWWYQIIYCPCSDELVQQAQLVMGYAFIGMSLYM